MKKIVLILILLTLILQNSFIFATKQKPLRYEIISEEQGLSHPKVTYIMQDSQGFLWFATQNGLNRYDGYQMTVFQNEEDYSESISSNWIRVVYEDQNRNLWIGTRSGGINLYDREKMDFRNWKHQPNDKLSLPANDVGEIFENQSGDLIVGVHLKGYYQFNHSANQFKKIGSSFQVPDYTGELQIHNSQQYSEEKISIEMIETWIRNPEVEITSVFEDKSHVLWVGTDGNGVYKFDRKETRFTHWVKDNLSNNSLVSNQVRAFSQDKQGNLWIGTNAGFSRLNRNNFQFKNWDKNFPFPIIPKVRSIHVDQNQTVWLGCRNSGLLSFDPATNQLQQWGGHSEDTIVGTAVWDIYEDDDHCLWFGTDDNGLLFFDPKKNEFRNYRHDPNNPNSLTHNRIQVILQDEERNFWLGTEKGLNYFIRDENRFINWVHDSENKNSISNNKVRAIYDDQKGNLWIGTRLGFNKFNKKTGQFTQFFKEDGLPSNIVYGILGDNHGNIWLSTPKGLAKFFPEKNEFKRYNIPHSNSFDMGAYYQTREGELVFGGLNGFISFFPDRVKDNQYIPPIVLTGFRKMGKELPLNQPKCNPHSIELSYEENFFSFEFSALDYTQPSNNQYQYKLEGVDQDWVYSGTRNEAYYTNINPGHYEFKVIGSNNDGVWNEEGISVRLDIIPPFWDTLWFKVMIGLFLAGSFLGVYRIRLNFLKDQNEKLIDLVDDRTKALKLSNTAMEKVNNRLISKVKELEDKNFIIQKAYEKEKRLKREKKELRTINVMLREELKPEKIDIEGIIGSSKCIREIKKKIKVISKTDSIALLTGETGTGKSMIAKAIHNMDNKRNKKSFVMINCANIPRELLEGELFGYEKGSYTGANKTKIGKVELADQGTLFLDEIGEMDYNLQSKLLTFIQEGTFYRIGSNILKKVDTRIIAATNKDLDRAIQDKLFRKDLFYRLNVFPIYNAPLRERKEDIQAIVEDLVKKFNAKFRKNITQIESESLENLLNYNWPGNIRELQNVVERAYILLEETDNILKIPPLIAKKMDQTSYQSIEDPSVKSQEGVVLSVTKISQILPLDLLVKKYLKNVLDLLDWKISGPESASELLQVNRHSLYRKLKKYALSKEEDD